MFYYCKLNVIIIGNNFDEKNFFLLLRRMKLTPMKLVLTFVAILGSSFAFAAPQPPPPTPPPPGLSVDSGIIFLVVASIFFVYYKIVLKKKVTKL